MQNILILHAKCLLLYFETSHVFIELFMFTEARRDGVIVIFDRRWHTSISPGFSDHECRRESVDQESTFCFQDAACNEKSRALDVWSTSRLDYNIQENVKPSNLLKAPETNRLPSRKTTTKKQQLWASHRIHIHSASLVALNGIAANVGWTHV